MKAWRSNLASMGYTWSDPTVYQPEIKKSYQILSVLDSDSVSILRLRICQSRTTSRNWDLEKWSLWFSFVFLFCGTSPWCLLQCPMCCSYWRGCPGKILHREGHWCFEKQITDWQESRSQDKKYRDSRSRTKFWRLSRLGWKISDSLKSVSSCLL